MKHCPNQQCPHLQAHGIASEYRDEIEKCSECGTPLVDGPALRLTKPKTPVAVDLWKRLAVTVLVPVVVTLASKIPLPRVYQLLNSSEPKSFTDGINMFSLGIHPIVAVYVIVEMFAMCSHRGRRLRVGGPIGRHKLLLGTLAVAFVFVALQAYFIDHGLSIGHGFQGPDSLLSLANILTLMAGTFLLLGLTRVIDRFGLGNGFSVILVYSLIFSIWKSLSCVTERRVEEDFTLAGFGLGLTAMMVIVVATIWLLKRNPRLPDGSGFQIGLRCPASGLLPCGMAYSILSTFVAVNSLFGLELNSVEKWLTLETPERFVIQLLTMVLLCVVFTIIYNLPSNIAEVFSSCGNRPLDRTEIASATRKTLWRYILWSIAFLVVCMVLGRFATNQSRCFDFMTNMVAPLSLILFTAVVMDIVAEWKARMRCVELVSAWPIHRVYAVDPAIRLLLENGIEAFPRGVHHRTMLQFFGPYVPVDLMVAPGDVTRTQEILYGALVKENEDGEIRESKPRISLLTRILMMVVIILAILLYIGTQFT